MKKFTKEYLKFKEVWCDRDDNPCDISDELCIKAFEIYKKFANVSKEVIKDE